jgi:hypothetical protein
VLERARILVLHVENEDGQPVSDADVLLLENPYSNPGTARAKSRSDANGRAEIELQPGGSWFVAVSHALYRSVVLTVDANWSEQTVVLSRGVRGSCGFRPWSQAPCTTWGRSSSVQVERSLAPRGTTAALPFLTCRSSASRPPTSR